MVQQVWNDKGLPDGTINKEVTNEFAKRLYKGVEKGYGKKIQQVDYDSPDFNMLAALQRNCWQFSAAKNYTQLRELSNALLDDNGKLRTFKEFEKAAKAINEEQVKYRLKAEYNLAVAGGQMARKWIEFDDDAMLQFKAVIDGRTTELCARLHNTTLPKEHPFWKTYYPPNHWGCRSNVIQVYGRAATKEDNIESADIPQMFRVNLAQGDLIFPKEHPYYIDQPKEVVGFGDTAFAQMQNRIGNKGKVFVNNMTINPAKKQDVNHLEEVMMKEKAADALADYFDTTIWLNPEMPTPDKDMRYSTYFSGVKPFKQPDYFFFDHHWELESYDKNFKYGKISNMLKNGAEQSDRIILKLKNKANIDEVIKRAKGSLEKSTKHLVNVKQVLLLDVNNKVYPIK